MVLESLARIVKVQLPAYLKRLPLPESVGGFIRLTGRWEVGGGGGGRPAAWTPLPAPPAVGGGVRGAAGPGRAPRFCLGSGTRPVSGCDFHSSLQASLAFSRPC